MKITKEQLRQLIKEELEEAMADKAASGFARKLKLPIVQKAIAALKDSLEAIGPAGAGTRKEEVIAILNQLGITGADLTKVIGTAKGEDRAAQAAASNKPTQ